MGWHYDFLISHAEKETLLSLTFHHTRLSYRSKFMKIIEAQILLDEDNEKYLGQGWIFQW